MDPPARALAPRDQAQVRPDQMLSNQVSRNRIERAKTLKPQLQEQGLWSTSTARFELQSRTTQRPDICGLYEFSCMYHVCIMY